MAAVIALVAAAFFLRKATSTPPSSWQQGLEFYPVKKSGSQ
jgi:hypothetical protein